VSGAEYVVLFDINCSRAVTHNKLPAGIRFRMDCAIRRRLS